MKELLDFVRLRRFFGGENDEIFADFLVLLLPEILRLGLSRRGPRMPLKKKMNKKQKRVNPSEGISQKTDCENLLRGLLNIVRFRRFGGKISQIFADFLALLVPEMFRLGRRGTRTPLQTELKSKVNKI